MYYKEDSYGGMSLGPKGSACLLQCSKNSLKKFIFDGFDDGFLQWGRISYIICADTKYITVITQIFIQIVNYTVRCYQLMQP